MPNQTLQLTKYLDSGRNSDLFLKKIVKIRPLIAELQLSKSGDNPDARVQIPLYLFGFDSKGFGARTLEWDFDSGLSIKVSQLIGGR